MESEKYLEGQSMQRPPLFESDGFIYWKNRFETYVKSKDLDLWHVITYGDFPPIQLKVRVTKVINGEFEKIKDIKVEDDSLPCDSPLEFFNCKKSLGSTLIYLTTRHLSVQHSTNLLSSKVSDPDLLQRTKPVLHTAKPFNYKNGCSEWPTCSWMNDGYCNGGNLPGTFIIENQLHYQDYEWYKALEDSELKDEALKKKRLSMEGFIKADDDESKEELCEVHEPPVCMIQRFEMIKYSFGQGEEYVAIKEDEYDDLARTSNNACRTYQEIFRMMDEGWKVTRTKE
ncbi:hypothetical protein Tco_0431755 [Tanacetum coccineum]